MAKYRKYDWPALLEAFEQSGLTQTQFCKERDLNPRYFSSQRSKRCPKPESGFTKLEVMHDASSALRLQVGRCQILCPTQMPLQSLVTLVRALENQGVRVIDFDPFRNQGRNQGVRVIDFDPFSD